ncbi:hypothetical protein OSB04_020154 [Centaurea solstitialis]|uniref:Uncharacterized protein n=1 Tax=Centaurea solstitialis TaxID=347529 RepID=A0AA38WGJ7_9ASTR|nr:hypothetical protein OSB04_020154 [Centaurea solstitialis]
MEIDIRVYYSFPMEIDIRDNGVEGQSNDINREGEEALVDDAATKQIHHNIFDGDIPKGEKQKVDWERKIQKQNNILFLTIQETQFANPGNIKPQSL